MNVRVIRRFVGPPVAIAVLGSVWFLFPARGETAISVIGMSLKEMLLVIPRVFVLMGLLDVWIPRERLSRHIGSDAGVRGTVIEFLIGSAAAGS